MVNFSCECNLGWGGEERGREGGREKSFLELCILHTHTHTDQLYKSALIIKHYIIMLILHPIGLPTPVWIVQHITNRPQHTGICLVYMYNYLVIHSHTMSILDGDAYCGNQDTSNEGTTFKNLQNQDPSLIRTF